LTGRRYWLANLLLALAAGFTLVSNFAFKQAEAADRGFELGVAAVILAGLALASSRGAARLPPLAVALTGAWLLYADALPTTGGPFEDSTQRWIAFGGAAAILAAAVAALCIHELAGRN